MDLMHFISVPGENKWTMQVSFDAYRILCYTCFLLFAYQFYFFVYTNEHSSTKQTMKSQRQT